LSNFFKRTFLRLGVFIGCIVVGGIFNGIFGISLENGAYRFVLLTTVIAYYVISKVLIKKYNLSGK